VLWSRVLASCAECAEEHGGGMYTSADDVPELAGRTGTAGRAQ